MTELNTGRSTFRMDAVGEATQARNNLGRHHELTVETETALADGGVGNGGHTDAATGNTGVIIKELLRGRVARAHTLEGGTTDGAVAEGERTYVCFFKYLIHK